MMRAALALALALILAPLAARAAEDPVTCVPWRSLDRMPRTLILRCEHATTREVCFVVPSDANDATGPALSCFAGDHCEGQGQGNQ